MSNDKRPVSGRVASKAARVRAARERLVARYTALSEPAQVAVGVVGGLLGLFVVALSIVYRAAIWRVIVFVLTALLICGLIAVLARSTASILRVRRGRRLAAERARRDEEEARRREREGLIQSAEAGRFDPLLDSGPLLLRNSESLWHRCFARVVDGRGNDYAGELFVTSMRVVFICGESPIEIPIESINALHHEQGAVEVVGKSGGRTQRFLVDDAELAAASIRGSVRLYHRQVDVAFDAANSRHIPQDVKTAVWQRDGGRCVQCGAADYLEFDHIIPHTRGGANTVQNVQLLCRRCNLKKGAAI